jgi:hypothetical protein
MDKRTIERNARAIVKAAIKDNWEQTEDVEGNKVESIFLGTVFALTPSGKYYTPWANGNVDACPRCKGEGIYKGDYCHHCNGMGSREAYEDELFQDALERAANKHDAWIESGEGAPCDLFIVRAVTEDDNE